MASKFLNMLKNRDWILADGATGTNLFAIGLEAGARLSFGTKHDLENLIKLIVKQLRRVAIFS